MSKDKHIHRCPICGEWTWRGICYVPHEVCKNNKYEMEAA